MKTTYTYAVIMSASLSYLAIASEGWASMIAVATAALLSSHLIFGRREV